MQTRLYFIASDIFTTCVVIKLSYIVFTAEKILICMLLLSCTNAQMRIDLFVWCESFILLTEEISNGTLLKLHLDGVLLTRSMIIK